MRPNEVVALIAGGVFEGNLDFSPSTSLHASSAVLRAVLERGGQVLLAAESAYVVPLLMAAAEYLEPRGVESNNEVPPAPVILAPPMMSDAPEDWLLSSHQESELGDEGTSLLEDLMSVGLFEGRWRPGSKGLNGASVFETLLRNHRPRGIVAVGRGRQAPGLLGVAESYHERADRDARLVHVFGRATSSDRPYRWEPIEEFRPERPDPPPMLDGEIIGKESEGRAWDEHLVSLADHAAEEASLALTIDRAIEEIMKPRRDTAEGGFQART